MPYLRVPAEQPRHKCKTPMREVRHYVPDAWLSEEDRAKPKEQRPHHKESLPDGKVGTVWLCEECLDVWKIKYRNNGTLNQLARTWVRLWGFSAWRWRRKYTRQSEYK